VMIVIVRYLHRLSASGSADNIHSTTGEGNYRDVAAAPHGGTTTAGEPDITLGLTS